ncbi:MAG: hypothetical protein ABSE06_04760 [Anaerolineaceae bacterium]|jgi:hypothetical protein
MSPKKLVRLPAIQIALKVILGLILLAGMVIPYQSMTASAQGIPTFNITDVTVDDTVTIQTQNYPAGQTFTVRMGSFGTLGVGGIVVGSFDSGSGGSFSVTFDIPEALHGRSRIAIRADSPEGFFSFNWFWNNTSSSSSSNTETATETQTHTPSAQGLGIPTFYIVDVNRDDNVTLGTRNFPAGQTFTVRMGKYGTLGIGGIEVGTFDSGDGGNFDKSFDIPDALKGQARIAIRADSSQGFFAFNWFWNNSVSVEKKKSTSNGEPSENNSSNDENNTSTPEIVVFHGIPTFSISSVSSNDTVTVVTSNFPSGQTFTVRMGAYGTMALGGMEVATTDSGNGGSFTATYNIPDALKGSQRIAIRMDSPQGFFAFNWFWNNNTN